MNKVLMCALLLTAASAWGAATPHGSAYDSRMQNIPYNSQNTTVINTRAGYITTLVFDADEEVITATAGFPQGWTITSDRNRMRTAKPSRRFSPPRSRTGRPTCL